VRTARYAQHGDRERSGIVLPPACDEIVLARREASQQVDISASPFVMTKLAFPSRGTRVAWAPERAQGARRDEMASLVLRKLVKKMTLG
jgi:hypothetical protein